VYLILSPSSKVYSFRLSRHNNRRTYLLHLLRINRLLLILILITHPPVPRVPPRALDNHITTTTPGAIVDMMIMTKTIIIQ